MPDTDTTFRRRSERKRGDPWRRTIRSAARPPASAPGSGPRDRFLPAALCRSARSSQRRASRGLMPR